MTRSRLFYIILLVKGIVCYATEQAPDIIIYNDTRYEFINSSVLMNKIFDDLPENRRPRFIPTNTALARGYVAIFEIRQNELILNRINGDTNFIGRIRLKKLRGLRINWFTGFLVLQYGDIVAYEGWTSYFENYKILKIKNGFFEEEINLNYEEYIEFRNNRFEQYRKTNAYRELFNRWNHGGIRDVDDFIKKSIFKIFP